MEGISIILPSLDPDEKLMRVIRGLLAEGFQDIIVVNDGSHPEHAAPFEEAAACPEVTVLTHEVNQGKGRAMKTAFAWCLEHRPNLAGVITVDGDDQHRPADVRACAEAMLRQPEKLWLGVRDFSLPEVPKRSRMGNRMTLGILRLFCGVKVSDSQTGLRAISRELLPMMLEVEGERYEYETEQLLAVHRRHIDIGEVVIETVYINENQTSHYRPLHDSLRVLRMIFRHILRFISSALFSFLVDLGLFTLLNLLLDGVLEPGLRRLTALVVARAASSLLNYTLNRNMVFRDKGAVGASMVRYYLLVVVQAAASYGLLTALSAAFRASTAAETPLKLLVDVLLFLASYQIQLRWVFRGEKT